MSTSEQPNEGGQQPGPAEIEHGGVFAIETINAEIHRLLNGHAPCRWKQVGPCVYCDDHGIRLYQGTLPDDKRTTPKCAPGEHRWDDANSMMQAGFYFLCVLCGEQRWDDEELDGEPAEDLTRDYDPDDDPNAPEPNEVLYAEPCPECGQHGACAYDDEGRVLVHIRNEFMDDE